MNTKRHSMFLPLHEPYWSSMRLFYRDWWMDRCDLIKNSIDWEPVSKLFNSFRKSLAFSNPFYEITFYIRDGL